MTVQKAQIVQFEELSFYIYIYCASHKLSYKIYCIRCYKKCIHFCLAKLVSFTICHQIRHLTQIHYARRGLETCFSRVALYIAFFDLKFFIINLAKKFLFYSKATLNNCYCISEQAPSMDKSQNMSRCSCFNYLVAYTLFPFSSPFFLHI